VSEAETYRPFGPDIQLAQHNETFSTRMRYDYGERALFARNAAAIRRLLREISRHQSEIAALRGKEGDK